VDRDNKLLLQITSGTVIRCLSLRHDGVNPPFVAVYKSGLIGVVVSDGRDSEVIVFDAKGEKVASVSFGGKVVEIDKCCGWDTREYLLLGCEGGALRVYEVVTLDMVAHVNLECERAVFASVKNRLAVLRMVEGNLVVTEFGNARIEVVSGR
jgi:hypothetical protein